jgi:hypothetical protein
MDFKIAPFWFLNHEFDMEILHYAKQGANLLEIDVFNTLENLYVRNALQSGIAGARIITVIA